MKTRALIIGAGVLVLSTLAVFGIANQHGPAEPTTASPPAHQQLLDLARRTDGDTTALGRTDAPVVIIEYADYRCPFCAEFDRDTLPSLVKEYIDEGTVRFEWRDFPIFGEESMGAAVAARAAGEQGKFWEYHHAVFAAAPANGHSALPKARLMDLAAQVGVADLARFEADLARADLRQYVDEDIAEATSLGAASAPVFLINDTPMAGAQPLDVFRQVIEGKLAQARP